MPLAKREPAPNPPNVEGEVASRDEGCGTSVYSAVGELSGWVNFAVGLVGVVGTPSPLLSF